MESLFRALRYGARLLWKGKGGDHGFHAARLARYTGESCGDAAPGVAGHSSA
jgi:hypothetical protein